jgi:hypothetical protein
MPEPWPTMTRTRCSTWRGWLRSGPTRTANAWKSRSASTPNMVDVEWPDMAQNQFEESFTYIAHPRPLASSQ